MHSEDIQVRSRCQSIGGICFKACGFPSYKIILTIENLKIAELCEKRKKKDYRYYNQEVTLFTGSRVYAYRYIYYIPFFT